MGISNSNFQVRTPLLVAVGLVAGILIGVSMYEFRAGKNAVTNSIAKFGEVMSLIDHSYVDTINSGKLVEVAIENMLEKLDPHTVYIPRQDVELSSADLKGEFEGIGIEFNIIRDTIMVITALPGGPSANVGLESGDKIIKVDDETVAGIGITIRGVIDRLRGPKGSKVVVGIHRKNQPELLEFKITRDKIPQFSVDASYMIDEETGYIKISRFSITTHEEFRQKLKLLLGKGMKRLVLDLQGNPGGLLDRAVDIADEMISGDAMIVSQKGKNEKNTAEYRAIRQGLLESEPVIVLIDENSASGSEIVAGALQDDDRGLVVGRRSFGKGLVQVPMNLNDGSELRLTIARFFTPSGRCIQKPYNGNMNDYAHEYARRYEDGELFSADSVRFNDSLTYHTISGRRVYGGGGIMPDIFVPLDTSYNTNYFAQLIYRNIIREYTLEYFDRHKAELSKWTLEEFHRKFAVSDLMLGEIIAKADREKVAFNGQEFNTSKSEIKNRVKSMIARSVWDNDGYYMIANDRNEIYQEALRHFDKATRLALTQRLDDNNQD
ncbi:MAG TPA: S41 family peptidase [Cyclobacteriaceae bacterium]|nr:S41 family peptidase [Cyclobacteriaceae bacterium]